MTVYDWKTIVRVAREKSAYYRNLYKDVPEDAPLDAYPLVESDAFWQSVQRDRGADLLTQKHYEGCVFRSGGTTGTPKFSPYTNEEWNTMCQLIASKTFLNNLSFGDRVGNLFYSGNLYASYDFMTNQHAHSPVPFVLVNFGGHANPADVCEGIIENRINVITGLPSVLIKLAEYIGENNIKGLPLEKIGFAGETLQQHQRNYIDQVIGRPQTYFSCGLAGNDYGTVGYFAPDCGFNEHHVDEDACYFEIIDPETGEIILEANRPGRIYITSRHKLLMPIIRYPIGDMAEYTDPEGIPNRRFRLLGRNSEMARVGILNLFKADFDRVAARMPMPINAYQLLITHDKELRRDRLTVLLAAPESAAEPFLEAVYEECYSLKDLEQSNMIAPTRVQIVPASSLSYNKRTGKLISVVDKRFTE